MAPPWGSLAALDLKTNKVVWEHRVGTIRDEAPLPPPFKLGVPMLGGPIVTAGGLAFLAATMDDYIRAFDVDDGKLLWEDRLPAGGQSTLMTYEVDGRQYVVTVDGGHGSFGTKPGRLLRAYALPGKGLSCRAQRDPFPSRNVTHQVAFAQCSTALCEM